MSKFDKLADIAVVIDSLHKTPKYSDTGRAMVRCTDVKYGNLDLGKTLKVNDDVFAEFSRRYTPKEEDIIITRVGSYGITARVNNTDFCLGQNTSVIVPKEIDARYLYFVLNSPLVKQQIEFSVVGAVQKTLSLKAINNLEIPRFDQETEKRISKFIGDLDDKIDLNTQTNQTLEQIAQAIFKSWFVDFEPVKAKLAVLEAGGTAEQAELAAMSAISGKTEAQLLQLKAEQPEADAHDCMDAGGRATQGAVAEGSANVAGGTTARMQEVEQRREQLPRMSGATYAELAQTAALFPSAMEESELGEIPEGWQPGILADIASFAADRIATTEITEDNYVSTENMLENKRGISVATALPGGKTVPLFEEGHILVSNIRPYFKKIWFARFDGGRSPDVLGFVSKDSEAREFLFNFLYQDLFFDFMMATSKGAKMPRGDKDAIMGYELTLPSHAIRRAYSNSVRSYYEAIESLNAENSSLASIRDALLPKLLAGDLPITNTGEATA